LWTPTSASSSASQACDMVVASESLPMRMQTLGFMIDPNRSPSPHRSGERVVPRSRDRVRGPSSAASRHLLPASRGEGTQRFSFPDGLFALLQRAIADVAAIARALEANLRHGLVGLRQCFAK